MAESRIALNIDFQNIDKLNESLERIASKYDAVKDKSSLFAASVAESSKTGKTAVKELNDEVKTTATSMTEMASAGSLEKMAKPAKSLRSELRDIKDEMQALALNGQVNSDRFIELGKRAGEINAAIGDAADGMNNFTKSSESAMNGLQNSISNTANALLSMDFGAAELGIQGINSSLKSVDVKQISGDVLGLAKALGGTLVQSVKTFGSVMIGIGKAILTNPIFLLATVLTAVGVAIYKLKDKFALFGAIVKGIGDAIDWVIGLFKKLTDWIGLTNFAEEELATKRAERAKKESERINNEATLRQNGYDRQIKLIQAKGDLNDREKRQIFELQQAKVQAELTKQYAERNSVQNQIKALAVKGSLNEEEMKQLKELKKAYQDLGEGIKNSRADLKANQITFNATRQKEEVEVENRLAEKRKQAWEKHKQELEKQQAELKRMRGDALAALAKISEQMELDAINDENQKAYQATINALKKERALILANKTLTADERKKITDYYEALEVKAKEDLYIKQEEKEKAHAKEINDITSNFNDQKLKDKIKAIENEAKRTEEAEIELRGLKLEQDAKALEEERKQMIDQYKSKGLDTLEVEQYYQNKSKELTQQYEDDLTRIQTDAHKKRIDEQIKAWEELGNGMASALKGIGDSTSSAFGEMVGSATTAFSQINDLLESEDMKINEKVAGIATAVTGMMSQIIGQAMELNKAHLEEQLTDIQNNSNAQQAIIDQQLQNGLISKEQADRQKYELAVKTYNAEEAMKKKAFESDKKMKIAQASIAMIQGMISAFAGAMQLGPIAGPIVGAVLAAAVGVMGGINIAKIKAQKYEAGTPPSMGGGGAISLPNIPDDSKNNVSLSKSGLSSKTESGKAEEKKEEKPMNVTVSISEIESVQNKVNGYKNVAQL